MELTPDFKIIAQGQNITESLKKNLINLELKDEDGNMADELTLNISSVYKRPKYGDELKVYLGYEETKLTYMGAFKVQTSTIKNKETMQITATGVDFSGELKVKKSREFINTNLKAIVSEIASEHLLTPVCDVGINISYIAQHDQSDLAFLQKIANDNQLIFSIKDNNLICVHKKQEKIKYAIDYKDVIDISITHSNKTKYESAKVIYRDTKLNKDKEVEVLEGTPQLILERCCKDDNEAKRIALAALDRVNTGTVTGDLTIPFKVIFAGGILNLSGSLDDGEYGITSVSHTLDSGGFTTAINFEK